MCFWLIYLKGKLSNGQRIITRTMVVIIMTQKYKSSYTVLSIFVKRSIIAFWKMSFFTLNHKTDPSNPLNRENI